MAEGNCWKNPALYKTRICDFWAAGKPCKYGKRCWFSHGPHELRSVPHLENNYAAKTASLFEVCQMLPPSKERSQALEQVDTALNASQNDFFQKVTVPWLNSIAIRTMSGKSPELDQQSIFSLNGIAQVLMQTPPKAPLWTPHVQHDQKMHESVLSSAPSRPLKSKIVPSKNTSSPSATTKGSEETLQERIGIFCTKVSDDQEQREYL